MRVCMYAEDRQGLQQGCIEKRLFFSMPLRELAEGEKEV